MPLSLRYRVVFVLMALGSVFSPQALALPGDSEQPIELEADSASFDQTSGISVYQGNVVITQGSMYLAAEKATVYFSNGRFQRMQAVGKPSEFRYQPAVDKAPITGTGQQIRYDVKTRKVIVSGNARFNQGSDRFSGERIEYDLSTDVVRADGGRVKFILQPDTKTQR